MNVVLNHNLNNNKNLSFLQLFSLPSITLRIRRVIAELAGGGTPYAV
jgi:hypothetical protein